jgi:3-hydroxyacyl-CoA dehydrogenase
MDSQADSGNRKRDRPAPTRHLVIVGGGTMGRGIAESALLAGLKVTLLDQSAEALQQASTWICTQPGVASHRSQLECLPMADLSRLSGVDVAIETVAENPELKQQVFAELEQHLASDALIATNTSSITLKRLLADVQRPERCCGLHFCYPVRSRRLVEVIRGGQTSAATVETATGFVTTLSKHPLVVDDSPGFVVNRLYVSYLNEALALLLDGIPLSEIEAAAVDFGMPSGPFEQMDLMGIDVAVRAGTHQFFAFPDRVVPSALLVKVMKSGRLGAKSGCGFYQWSAECKRGSVDPWVQQLIEDRMTPQPQPSREKLQLRLFLPMVLESQRLLQQQRMLTASEIDAALWHGLGFRVHAKTGLMEWASATPSAVLEGHRLQFAALGDRFALPDTARAA